MREHYGRLMEELCKGVIKPYYLEFLRRNQAAGAKFLCYLEALSPIQSVSEICLAYKYRQTTEKFFELFPAHEAKLIQASLQKFPLDKAYRILQNGTDEYGQLIYNRMSGSVSMGDTVVRVKWSVTTILRKARKNTST